MTLSRRHVLGLGAAAAGSLIPSRAARAGEPSEAPPSPGRGPAGPVVVASANGLKAVARAYSLMTEKNADPLDAAIAGVNIQELDPEDHSVGLGGLPNEHGVVQLDASCMHGPSRRAGAVAALEGVATASLVAKAVMDHTDHIMLVGEGATRFALDLGFEEQDLLTEESRRNWLRWRARRNPRDNWLEPEAEADVHDTHGTINCCAVDAHGDLGSVTTTSGLSWKIPGRIGDSPIIGAGQYCDNDVGAAGSTGRGEANIKVCGAFLTVDEMRRGASPEEACVETLRRVVAMTEPRLLDENGRPRFQIQFYALAKDGRFGGATMHRGKDPERAWGRSFAVADAGGARHVPLAFLFDT